MADTKENLAAILYAKDDIRLVSRKALITNKKGIEKERFNNYYGTNLQKAMSSSRVAPYNY